MSKSIEFTKEMERICCFWAWKYAKKSHMLFEELQSVAFFAFCDAKRTYLENESNAPFKAYLQRALDITLKRAISNDLRFTNVSYDSVFNVKVPCKYFPRDVSDCEFLQSDDFIEDINDRINSKQSIDNLSCDSQEMIQIIIENHSEIFGDKKETRQRVLNYFLSLNWKRGRINKCFEEIKSMLSL